MAVIPNPMMCITNLFQSHPISFIALILSTTVKPSLIIVLLHHIRNLCTPPSVSIAFFSIDEWREIHALKSYTVSIRV